MTLDRFGEVTGKNESERQIILWLAVFSLSFEVSVTSLAQFLSPRFFSASHLSLIFRWRLRDSLGKLEKVFSDWMSTCYLPEHFPRHTGLQVWSSTDAFIFQGQNQKIKA